MGGERGGYDPNAEREAQLEADRETAEAPLPGADQRHYRGGVDRQIDLDVAAKSNVAKAAGDIGLTTSEWLTVKSDLRKRRIDRDPNLRDAQEFLKNQQ